MNVKKEKQEGHKILRNWSEYLSYVGFIVMLLAVSVNVFSRYIFSKSFAWTEEIAYMGFTWAVFMGMVSVFKRQGMIAIDVLVDRLPAKVQRLTQILVFLLLTVGNVIMIYYSGKLTVEAWVRPTANLRIPYSFIDVSAVISFLALTYYSARFLYWTMIGREMKTAALEDRA